jgi:hypothetical protein
MELLIGFRSLIPTEMPPFQGSVYDKEQFSKNNYYTTPSLQGGAE